MSVMFTNNDKIYPRGLNPTSSQYCYNFSGPLGSMTPIHSSTFKIEYEIPLKPVLEGVKYVTCYLTDRECIIVQATHGGSKSR